MSDKNHFYYVCSICNETWPTPEACKNHEIADHFYCAECQRHFRNMNNIRMVSCSIIQKLFRMCWLITKRSICIPGSI
jgi:hypothetical protein